MKKFGPYKGISNSKNTAKKPDLKRKAVKDIPVESVLRKASLEEVKKRYSDYISEHQRLSDSLDEDEFDNK